MTTVHEPRSRRDRPAKAPLSRQWIVDATIRVMRQEGLQRATMRRVAKELDTGPASLYVYFANNLELHAAVIDELTGQARVQMPAEPAEAVKALVTMYRDLLNEHPGLARSALVVRPTGPNLLLLFERILACLLECGAAPLSASWGADLLLQLATATAAEHAEPEHGDVDDGTTGSDRQRAISDAIRSADPARLPLLAAHADVVLGGTPAQRWQWALDTQISGLLSVPPPELASGAR